MPADASQAPKHRALPPDPFARFGEYSGARKEFRVAGTSGITLAKLDMPANHYKRPSADEFCLTLQLRITGNAKVDHGVRWTAGEATIPDFILSPCRTDLSYEYDAGGRRNILMAILPSRFIASVLRDSRGPSWPGDFGPLHTRLFADPTIAELMLRVWQEALAGTRESALVADTAWTSVAALLLRASGQSSLPAPRGGLAGWQLRRIIEHIQYRLTEDVSLDELAALVGLSPKHLCTAFRNSTGLPPHRWQVERRVERAKSLLADPALTITEVALACGFGTPSHFATTFRRVTGRTATEWQRECLK